MRILHMRACVLVANAAGGLLPSLAEKMKDVFNNVVTNNSLPAANIPTAL